MPHQAVVGKSYCITNLVWFVLQPCCRNMGIAAGF
jgi:hypothetical protein